MTNQTKEAREAAWLKHATTQLDDALADAKSCGLTYEETCDVIVHPPGNCADIDDLLDYMHIIQRMAIQPWVSTFLRIEPCSRGELRQKFVIAPEFRALLEVNKEED